jgi:hypothetical protein
MRKVALLTAVVLSAMFANTSSSVALTDEELYKMNKSTHDLFRGAAVAGQPAAAEPAMKHKKKKK